MQFTIESLNFELNNSNYTAKVIRSPKAIGDLFIPQFVDYCDHKYIILMIGENSFYFNTKLKSIKFPDDSELITIEKNAFSNSLLKKIFFPSKVLNFEDGWCKSVHELSDISVSPNNNHIKYIENKFLLLKTNENDFDKLIFVRRDIEEANIQSYIKIIGPFSFSDCKNLKSINFSTDSQLISISESAFSFSQIESIFIPSAVKILEEGWCLFTSKLTKLSISPLNDNFILIDSKYLIKRVDGNDGILVFAVRDIKDIVIPSFISRIASGSFTGCKHLKKVTFSMDSKLSSIGKEAFTRTSIESISIPSNVTRIEEAAFSYCSQLKFIEFPPYSKIESIEKDTFNFTNIQKISIPSKVTKICQNAFLNCYELKSIEISEDSELVSIEKSAFSNSSLEDIFLPSKIKEFDDGWCEFVYKLTNISVSPNNNYLKYIENKFLLLKTNESQDNFDKLIFARRDLKEGNIPSDIKIIGPFSFQCCQKLKTIFFAPDSQLVSISESAFSKSTINNISIPSSVFQIDTDAFLDCYDLRVLEFCPDSQLHSIGERAFINTRVKNIKIPSNVAFIGKNAFYQSTFLETVEILSKEITIGSGCFMNASKLFLMSLPNLTKLTIGEDAFYELPANFTLFASPNI